MGGVVVLSGCFCRGGCVYGLRYNGCPTGYKNVLFNVGFMINVIQNKCIVKNHFLAFIDHNDIFMNYGIHYSIIILCYYHN